MNHIIHGSRVKVFDHRRFKNDVDTPLSVTIRPATVVCRYGMKYKISGYRYPDLIDVIFDGETNISHAHFTHGVHLMRTYNGR